MDLVERTRTTVRSMIHNLRSWRNAFFHLQIKDAWLTYDGYEVGRIYWDHPNFHGRARVTDGIVALVQNNQRIGWVLLIDSEVRMVFDNDKMSLELRAHKEYAFHIDSDFVRSYPQHLQIWPSAVNTCSHVVAHAASRSNCNATWVARQCSNEGTVARSAARDASKSRMSARRVRNQRSNW